MTLIPAWVDGRLTPVEKLAVHRLGLRHEAVSVFAMDRHRILIQRRALSKYHTPGLWANTCCTHPLWGEAPADCAHRRLGEELGLSVRGLEHRGRIEYRADVGCGLVEHEVVEVFTAEADAAAPLLPDPTEVMATRWIDLDDLRAEVRRHPERFTPWLRVYLDEHASRIFGALT